MARQFERSYTSDHVVRDDGSVEFACSTDTSQWPWLDLAPRHPIVVQAQNFWASVGASLIIGRLEDGQWSALTWTDWECAQGEVSQAVRGLYQRDRTNDDETYLLELFDSEGRKIVQMRGRGVVFRNRNFEQWRAKAKSAAAKGSAPAPIEFANREALGIGPQEHQLIGGLEFGDDPFVRALITPQNGLPPANPMLGGSGDHVNSVHMVEAARQALCLLSGNPQVSVTGGEMKLNRYVELGVQMRLVAEHQTDGEVRFALEQLDRNCAQITLRHH